MTTFFYHFAIFDAFIVGAIVLLVGLSMFGHHEAWPIHPGHALIRMGISITAESIAATARRAIWVRCALG